MSMYNINTMAKSDERTKARKMRREGESIKEIAKSVCVSPSTVSIWCKDIELSDEQVRILETRMKDPTYGLRKSYLYKLKEAKNMEIESLRLSGMNKIGSLSNRELFLTGAALYWAEGFKKDKQIGFANSDPRMLRFIIQWFTECLGITPDQIRARVTINHNYVDDVREIQQYWQREISLPSVQFQKPTIQHIAWKKKYDDKKDYKGVLRLRVNMSLKKLRTILGYIDGLGATTML